MTRRGSFGVERAHVHQPRRPDGAERGDDLARKSDVHALEVIPRGLVEDADEVDDSRGATHQAFECGRIVYVRLDHIHSGQQEKLLRVEPKHDAHYNTAC